MKNFVKPNSLEEALEYLNSSQCTILAGGTDLMVELHKGEDLGESILDISSLKELKCIALSEDAVNIYSGASHSEIETSEIINEKLPMLSKACSLVGSTLIRNRGTIGGNIVNNASCADTIPPLLIAEAEVVLKSKASERKIKLQEFLNRNGKVNLSEKELLYCIEVKPLEGYRWQLIKVGRRKSLAISRLTLAIALKAQNGIIDDLRLCPGAMLSKPSRLYDTEDKFKGKALEQMTIEGIAQSAVEEVEAKSGRRWSSEYKEPVLKGLIIRTLEEWR
jgi:carbon-monoxide dehydrogenase medium subunit/xanthine dehydrogenase FAD-binding subunit